MEQKILQGDGTWPFTVVIDGQDIVVRGKHATWFGGSNDPQDAGSTASGLSTKDDPDLLGCALPMYLPGFKPTAGSPLPKMPYRTTVVEVWAPDTNKTVRVPLIDIGPSKAACVKNQTAIDLTQAAFRALGFSLQRGLIRVDYRILGAGKILSGEVN